jgi:hypothetical protein
MLWWEPDAENPDLSWLFRFDACFHAVPEFLEGFASLVKLNIKAGKAEEEGEVREEREAEEEGEFQSKMPQTHLKISRRNMTLRVVVRCKDRLPVTARIVEELYHRTHFVYARGPSLPTSVLTALRHRGCHLYTPEPLPNTSAILITFDKGLHSPLCIPSMLGWIEDELRAGQRAEQEDPGPAKKRVRSSNHLLLPFLDAYHSDKFGSFGKVGL